MIVEPTTQTQAVEMAVKLTRATDPNQILVVVSVAMATMLVVIGLLLAVSGEPSEASPEIVQLGQSAE